MAYDNWQTPFKRLRMEIRKRWVVALCRRKTSLPFEDYYENAMSEIIHEIKTKTKK